MTCRITKAWGTPMYISHRTTPLLELPFFLDV